MTQVIRALITRNPEHGLHEFEFDPATMGYLCFQQEEAPSTGTKHWQGYVEFKTKKRFNAILNICGPCHITPVLKDNGASTYCLKEETAIFGTRKEFGTKKKVGRAQSDALLKKDVEACKDWDEVLDLPGVSRQMQWAQMVWNRRTIVVTTCETMRNWQIDVLQKLKHQNNREVLFVVDIDGGAGKSTLARWLYAKQRAFICQGGKAADIVHAFDLNPIVCFDLARSNSAEYWPWQAIEYFKNGFAFSPKYDSTSKVFEPCKIVVFCNEMPDMTKLSRDRYSIINLSEEMSYRYFQSNGLPIPEELEEQWVDF